LIDIDIATVLVVLLSLCAAAAFISRARRVTLSWLDRNEFRVASLAFSTAFSRSHHTGGVNASVVFRVTAFDRRGTLRSGWLQVHEVLSTSPRITPEWET